MYINIFHFKILIFDNIWLQTYNCPRMTIYGHICFSHNWVNFGPIPMKVIIRTQKYLNMTKYDIGHIREDFCISRLVGARSQHNLY